MKSRPEEILRDPVAGGDIVEVGDRTPLSDPKLEADIGGGSRSVVLGEFVLGKLQRRGRVRL